MNFLIQGFKKHIRPAEADHIQAGKWGEKKAAAFLRKKGYRILGQRVRVGRRDEIDLVARQKNALVFVEVKTRSSLSVFRPSAAVDKRKQKALTRAAATYLSKLRKKPELTRFDVIEVIGTPGTEPEIHHLEQAFRMGQYRSIRW